MIDKFPKLRKLTLNTTGITHHRATHQHVLRPRDCIIRHLVSKPARHGAIRTLDVSISTSTRHGAYPIVVVTRVSTTIAARRFQPSSAQSLRPLRDGAYPPVVVIPVYDHRRMACLPVWSSSRRKPGSRLACDSQSHTQQPIGVSSGWSAHAKNAQQLCIKGSRKAGLRC